MKRLLFAFWHRRYHCDSIETIDRLAHTLSSVVVEPLKSMNGTSNNSPYDQDDDYLKFRQNSTP